MFVGVSTALTAVRRVFHPFVREGLKLYYRFTGTFNETTPDFLLDGSTSFDGTNDYISIADADNLSFGDGTTDSAFSVSAWVKMDDATNFKLIAKGVYNTDGEYKIETGGDDKIYFMIMDESVADAVEYVYTSAVTSYENQWIHITCTYDGRGGSSANAGQKIYLNGLATSISLAGAGTYVAMENLGGNVHIGRSDSSYANGSIANVGIWNRALSASEIESIYWRGSYSELKDTELTNLVSWYDLKETSLGSTEYVTNGTFDSDYSSWSLSGATAEVVNSQLKLTSTNANGRAIQSITFDADKTYQLTVDNVSSPGSGAYAEVKVDGWLTDGAESYDDGSDDYARVTSGNTLTRIFKSSSSGAKELRLTDGSSGSSSEHIFDNASIKEYYTPDSHGSNHGYPYPGTTTNTDSYSGESPFKPRIQDKANPKMAVQLADGSTSFDGTNDYIDLNNVSNFANLTQGTISAWFKTPDLASYRTLISGSDRTDGSSECILLFTNTGKIRYVNQDNASVSIEVDTNSAFDDNEWHHVALTVDGTGNKIYVDGSLQPVTYVDGSSSTQKFFNDVNDIDSLKIGANEDSSGTESFFNGSIANVAIHSSALNQTQVQELMFAEKYSGLSSDLKTNLVSWYDMGSTTLGSEMVTNGDYSNGSTGWTLNGFSIVNGQATVTDASATDYGLDSDTITGFDTGKRYQLSYDCIANTGGGQSGVYLRNADLSYAGVGNVHTDTGTKTLIFTPTATSHRLRLYHDGAGAGNTTTFDNVSIKEITLDDSKGSNHGSPVGTTTNTDSYSGESPFKPRIQDKANPKMAVQLADGSTSFDGTNDYIDLNNVSNFANLTQGTISAWFKTPDLASYRTLISGSDRTDGSSECILLFTNTGKIRYVNQDNASVSIEVDTNSAFDDNEWHHVALTVDGTGNKIYVDGSLQPVTYVDGSSSTQKFFNDVNDIDSLKIGANEDSSGTESFFNGSIANVAIHSSALNQTQVQELMFAEKYSGLSSDLKTNLVSWYDMGSTTLGSEMVTNGDYSNGSTGWTLNGFSIVNGQATVTDASATDYGLDSDTITGFDTGKRYQLSYDCIANTGGGQSGVYLRNADLSYAGVGNVHTDTGTKTLIFTPTATSHRLRLYHDGAGAGNTTTFDNVSIKEITLDDSKGTNHGSPVGATTTTGYTSSPHGVVDPLNFGDLYSGRSLDFDGSNDYVEVTSNGTGTFNNQSFSISAWVNFDTLGSDNTIFSYDYTAHSSPYYACHLRTKNSADIFFGWNDGSSYQGLESSGTLIANTWYHIVATFTSGSQKIYINGSLDNSSTRTDTITYYAQEVWIGKANYTAYMDGDIKSLKYFNSVLTQAQVQQLFTAPETVLPTGVSASNLKLDLPMQEGSGSYIYDGSGNQNHGTISGATWVTGQEYGYQSSLVRSNTPMIFDGSNDYVNTGSTFQSTFRDSFTISAWVKFNDGNPSGSTAIVGNRNSSGEDVCIFAIDTSGKLYVQYKSDNDNKYATSNSAVFSNGATQWTHCVAVVNNSTSQIYLYVNGSVITLDGTNDGDISSITMGDFTIVDNLYIGARNENGTANMLLDGIINEVAIWDTNLDADAVAQLYNSGVPLLPTSDSGNYDNSDDLQGYWRNDNITTWTDRANTGVASFDGVDDYIAKTSATGIPTGYPVTLSAWFKTGASTTGISDAIFGVYNPSSANNWLAIGIEDGGIRAWIRTNSGTNANAQGSGYDDGNWHHAVVVYTSDTDRKVYVDGSLISTITDTLFDSYPSSLSVISVGRHGDVTPGEYFDGQIAGCNIFNVSLTASEVTELYNIDKRSSISGHSKFSNCVASYLMGADSSDTTSTIQDQTSNNNDGTVSSASLVGYNDGTASGSPVSIVIPEGSTEGRDNQGFLLSDTTSITNGIRLHGSEHISIQDSEVLSFGDGVDDKPFSLEAWIKMDDATHFKVMGKGVFNSTAEYIFYTASDDKLYLYLYDESESSTYEYAGTSSAITSYEGQWTHVACTYNGVGGASANAGIKIYINGSVASMSLGGAGTYVAMENLGADFHIGRDGGTYSKGLVDETRIYSKELSASEVLKNYNNGKSSHQ